MTTDFLGALRPEALNAPPSGIVEVFRHGHGRPGIVPLWAGEGDLPTPAFIADAAARSMAAGETFYTNNAGIPELREALARYHDRLYGPLFGASFDPARFIVTSGGMHAILLASTMVAGPGDEVIVPTPAWPNFAASVGLRGAAVREVPLGFGNDGWTLDVEQVAAAVTPRTRAIFVNSPANPTGWTADRATLQAILDLSRRHGFWIVADEVYGRFYYGEAERAPSFHDIMDADDRILFVNTFSKNWAMTGWRIGWLEIPPALSDTAQNLVQYSSSGTATFMQRAATVAIDEGEAFVARQIERARRGLEIATDALGSTGKVRFARPPGAFYLFFSIDGRPDTRRLGLTLVDEANVGIAPGDAFGPAGRGFMRLCFARGEETLSVAMSRMKVWLERPTPVL